MSDAIQPNQALQQHGLRKRLGQRIWSARLLYLILLPGFIHLIIFKLAPIFGIVISFQDYNPFRGVFGSEWVWFEHFVRFFSNPYALVLIRNTALLAIYTLIFTFFIPLIFALFLNEVLHSGLKRSIQTVSVFPYFVSSAVIVSIAYTFFSPQGGLVNRVIEAVGFEPIFFMADPGWFRPLYVGISVWQVFGYNAIIYLAAIAGVDPELYDVAEIDGANRWKKMLYVTLPGIQHVTMVMIILSIGRILSVDVGKVLLMYNPSVYETADILQTFVYRTAFATDGFPNYSYAAAVGLVQSVFAFLLVVLANKLAKMYQEESAIF